MELTTDELGRLEGEGRFDFYWRTWQKNPRSVVFVPLAHILLGQGLADRAVSLSEEGLVYHPELVSGRLVFARALMQIGAWDRARGVLQGIIALVPSHPEAREMLLSLLSRPSEPRENRSSVRGEPVEPRHQSPSVLRQAQDGRVTPQPEPWRTLTMARILANQGHVGEALQICEERLTSRPDDPEARRLATELKERLAHD